jgi:deoxyxylulose-5-phosphate synthase
MLPGFTVMAAADEAELRHMIRTAVEQLRAAGIRAHAFCSASLQTGF